LKETAVAVRYAKAFIAVYKKSGDLDRISSELSVMAGLYRDSHKFRNVIQNPAVSMKVKEGILDDVAKKAGFSEDTSSALTFLLQNGRAQIINEVAEEFEKMVFAALGRVRVEVTSADELTDSDKKAIAKKIKETTGRDAVMDTQVDPSLIGGVITKIGSNVMDGSVKNQLKALRVGV